MKFVENEQTIKNLNEAVRIGLMIEGERLVSLVVQKIDDEGITVDGDLKRSIMQEVSIEKDRWLLQVGSSIKGKGGGVPYPFCVEYGTKPHAPPYDAIYKWVIKKGIAAEFTKSGKRSKSKSALIAAEYAADDIWWSIVHHGTQAHPFFSVVIESQLPFIADNIARNVRERTA